MPFLEQDLYEPIALFLKKKGYQVQSEIKNMDIAGKTPEGHLFVVEMKKTLNMNLLLQAVDRLSVTNLIYLAVPRPQKAKDKNWKNKIKLLKRLDFGLITVAMDSESKYTEFILHPGETYKKGRNTAKTVKEMEQRSGTYNTGGMTKQKIVTAYREKAICIACFLKGKDSCTLQEIKEQTKIEESGRILGNNFYGWFEKKSRGIYTLTPRGEKELLSFPEVVRFYEKILCK